MKKLKSEEAITILKYMMVDIPVPKAAVTQIKRNEAIEMAINALKCSEILNSSDTISRQAAIDAVMEFMPSLTTPDGSGQFDREIFEAQEMFVDIGQALNKLPPAQPEKRTEERTETHACDLISRQAAIDAHYEYCNKHPDAGFPVWSLKILENLPSAQPEIVRCKDCKHHWTHRCMDSMPTEICELGQTFYDANVDFCSLAERRTDESD